MSGCKIARQAMEPLVTAEARARSSGLRTRECPSALNAMHRSRRGFKRDSIYPRYS